MHDRLRNKKSFAGFTKEISESYKLRNSILPSLLNIAKSTESPKFNKSSGVDERMLTSYTVCSSRRTEGKIQCESKLKTSLVRFPAICNLIIMPNAYFRCLSCMHVRTTQNLTLELKSINNVKDCAHYVWTTVWIPQISQLYNFCDVIRSF